MDVLAVDTCLEPGSIALFSADASAAAGASGEPDVVALPPGWRSVALHEEIRRLLARHNLTTADVDRYAVTAGPGAFTGVRLGLTAVKGFAEAHGKSVVTVSTLEALAFAAKNSDKCQVTSDENEAPASESLITRHASLVTALAPVFDARRGQIFGALYAVENYESSERTERTERTEFRPILPDMVCPLHTFLRQIQCAELAPERLRFCVTDEAILLPAIEEFGWGADSLLRVSPHLAGAVARMGAARFRQGKGIGALAADANYVRASDAELFWKE